MGLLCAGGDPALSGCGEVVAYVRSGSNVIFLGYGTEAQKWRLSAELIPKNSPVLQKEPLSAEDSNPLAGARRLALGEPMERGSPYRDRILA